MQDRSSGLVVGERRSLENPLNVVLRHGLAAQGHIGAAAARGQAPARHIDDDPADLDPRHALGCVDSQARGVFSRAQIDHRAALDPVRTLVADAQHLASVGAPVQRR